MKIEIPSMIVLVNIASAIFLGLCGFSFIFLSKGMFDTHGYNSYSTTSVTSFLGYITLGTIFVLLMAVNIFSIRELEKQEIKQ